LTLTESIVELSLSNVFLLSRVELIVSTCWGCCKM